MREEDKPFVCYKQGWSMKIVPRNGEGWRALGFWMAAFGVMLAAFLATMSALPSEQAIAGAAVVFVVAATVWAIAMIRWMLARSEIIDLKELIALKRERDRTRR